MKKIKLLTGYHLTVTERAHIRQLLDSGQELGSTSRKYYMVTKLDSGTWQIIIRTKMSDDFGRPKMDNQKVTVEYQ